LTRSIDSTECDSKLWGGVNRTVR